MKTKQYIFSLLVVAMGLSSCSDFLDEKVYSKITNEYLITTPDGMASTVNAMYNYDRTIFRSGKDTETILWTNLMRGTDITVVRAGDGADPFGRYINLLPSNNWVNVFWQHYYKLISNANSVVYAYKNNVDKSNAVARKATAEACVFRALSYFSLLRKYDRIYLTTRVTTPDNVNEKIEYKPANPDEVYILINKDLDFAIDVLPWHDEPGRVNQAYARQLKADVAMWQENYEEAITQTEEIINKSGYQLVELSKIFEGANLDHSETIFMSSWSKSLGGHYPSATKPSGHRMSLHFLPRYEKLQGVDRNQEDGGYTWARTFPNDYLLGLYDKEKDKRYTTFYKHFWTYNNATTMPQTAHLGDVVTTTSKSVYIEQLHPGCMKYLDKWTREVNESESFKDIILCRLAETFIIAAEANLRCGYMDKARAYFNKTWMRAGNDEFLGDVTLEMIIEEHARELAFEGQRWYYLKRLGILVERVREHGGELTDMVKETKCRDNIQDYHVRWPIPQAEIDNMGKENFPQNENYD